jgi:hypothetical protein
VATPDKPKTESALGQAVSKTGNVSTKKTRLKELGTERKPEAVMKIPSERSQSNVMDWWKLLNAIASIL